MMNHSILQAIALSLALLASACANQKNVRINSEADLKNVRLGVVSGSNHDIAMSGTMDSRKYFRFDDISAMLAALEIGKIDACYIENVTTDVVCRAHPSFQIHPSSMGEKEIGIIFNKMDTALCNQVNEALDILMNDSIWENMKSRWLGEGSEPDTTGCYCNHITSGAPLKVGTIGLHFPYNYVLGRELVGFEIEMANRIGIILNRPVEFQMLTGNALIPALNARKIDMVATLVQKSPERERSILFSKPYMHSSTVYLTRSRN